MRDPEAVKVIASALQLAKERVTGADMKAKLARQQEIGNALERIRLGCRQDSGTDPQLAAAQAREVPAAARIRELLGREDSLEIRDALAAWDA